MCNCNVHTTNYLYTVYTILVIKVYSFTVGVQQVNILYCFIPTGNDTISKNVPANYTWLTTCFECEHATY